MFDDTAKRSFTLKQANEINAAYRNCRIGKVTPKAPYFDRSEAGGSASHEPTRFADKLTWVLPYYRS